MTTFSKWFWPVAAGALVGSIQFVVTFFAWAMCDGPKPSEGALRFFELLSFPVLTVLGGGVMNIRFYEPLIANSMLWGAVVGASLFLILRWRGQHLGPMGRGDANRRP